MMRETTEADLKRMRAYAKAARLIRCRVADETGDFYGFVVSVSPTLMLLHVCVDFQANGMVLFDRRALEKVGTHASLDFQKRFCDQAALSASRDQAGTLDISSMAAALKSLRGRLIAVEHEDDEGQVLFAMGRVTRVHRRRLAWQGVDAFGDEEEATSLDIDDVRRVLIGDRYVETYRRFLDVRSTG
ncbi:MAG: hypothetical protein AAFR04_13690 [Pseudomonadota bacterium]